MTGNTISILNRHSLLSDGTPSAGASNPSKRPEFGTQRRDEIGRMLRIVREHKALLAVVLGGIVI